MRILTIIVSMLLLIATNSSSVIAEPLAPPKTLFTTPVVEIAQPKRGATKQLRPAGSLNSDGNNNKAPDEALGGPRKRLRLTSRRR